MAELEQQGLQEVIVGYIEIFWRRKVWVFIPLLIGILSSGFLISYLPNIYRSNTLILVEAQQVPQDFVKSVVSGSIEGRLSTIQQQILSRTNLQKLIKKYQLYQSNDVTFLQKAMGGLSKRFSSKTVSPLSAEETVGLMRKNIKIETIGGRRKRVDAFTISFDGESPERVMNVTNELASLFIEENLRIREQLVEGTTLFLDNELKNLRSVLEGQEKQIGDYKRKFIGELPEQLEANLRALDRFQTDLLSSQFARRAATDRITLLESTLEGGNGIPSQADSSGRVNRRTLSIEERLLNARGKLTEIRREYNEDYPDIQMLELEIQNLEKQRLKTSTAGEGQLPGISTARQVFEVDIENQIQKIRVESKGLEEREKRIRSQVRIFEQRVENVPTREQELAILVRDYMNTQNSYQVLLDKKLNAKISENLEKRQKGERFRIIDPANLPEKPISPNRLKIGLLGLLLGLGGGIALAFLREQFNKLIQRPEEIEKMTSFPILATIPDFTEEMMKGDR